MFINVPGSLRTRVSFEFILNSLGGASHEKTGRAHSVSDTALPRATFETITDFAPALVFHPNAAAFRRFVRYQLFSPFRDYAARVITPHTAIQKMNGVSETNHGFCSGQFLEEFSKNVWPLVISAPRHWLGQARTVERNIPEPVQLALDAAYPDPATDRVWLGSGVGVTHDGVRKAGNTYQMEMREFADRMTQGHPARELLDFLNGLSPTCLRKILAANWDDLVAAWDAMPAGTDHERARRRQAQCILLHLQDRPPLIYCSSDRTPRAFALGLSVNSLPRELRKIALRGCVELDARACQLAIVARQWGLTNLTGVLETRRSVWTELTGHLGLDAETYKPTIKRLVYGIVFGAREVSLRAWMRDGDEGIQPVTNEQADAFLGHPLIAELLAGRNERLREIRRDKFVMDAFGQRREYDGREVRHRSLLAQEVQSYEVALMMSLLPRIQRNYEDVHVVSWLHDGLSLWFSDKAKAAATVKGLCADFSRKADALGFRTELEVGGEPPFCLGSLI